MSERTDYQMRGPGRLAKWLGWLMGMRACGTSVHNRGRRWELWTVRGLIGYRLHQACLWWRERPESLRRRLAGWLGDVVLWLRRDRPVEMMGGRCNDAARIALDLECQVLLGIEADDSEALEMVRELAVYAGAMWGGRWTPHDERMSTLCEDQGKRVYQLQRELAAVRTEAEQWERRYHALRAVSAGELTATAAEHCQQLTRTVSRVRLQMSVLELAIQEMERLRDEAMTP